MITDEQAEINFHVSRYLPVYQWPAEFSVITCYLFNFVMIHDMNNRAICVIPIEKLAKECKVTPKTIKKHLGIIEDAGYISSLDTGYKINLKFIFADRLESLKQVYDFVSKL